MRLLEELSLWILTGDVLARPIVQIVKASGCAFLLWSSKPGGKAVKLWGDGSVLSFALTDMVVGDREGLLNVGWLVSWRLLKELRDTARQGEKAPVIIVGTTEFMLPVSFTSQPQPAQAAPYVAPLELTWLYQGNDEAPEVRMRRSV